MRRIQIVLALAGGFVILWMTLLTSVAQNVQAARPLMNPQQVSTPIPGALCSNSITTTSVIQNNYTYTDSALMASYTNLALIQGNNVPPTTTAVYPPKDQWFKLGNATPGNIYTFEASPEAGNYNLGMEIYNSTNPPTVYRSNIDTGDGPSAKIEVTFPGLGPYYIRVFQISSVCYGAYYRFNFSYVTPTVTPTLTPKPTKTVGPTRTPFSGEGGVDKFEPNDNFDEATTIGLNVKYTGLNFVQWQYDPGSWDNDFFRARVKPGMLVTCKTLELAPGTDTNLILYDANRNGIDGSDDVDRAAGDLSSSVTYYVTYEGWLYALVGEAIPRSLSEQASTGYSFECIIVSQETPTPAPTPTEIPGQPTRTPIPTETPIPSPTLTPTPPFVVVKPLPTATPPGLPTLQIPVSLLAYYDANGNNKYDPGEGIVGISARVIDLTTGNLLAQGYTDETGRASFVVSAPGAVQLTVPYLNYSAIILPAGGVATLRVSARELPNAIP